MGKVYASLRVKCERIFSRDRSGASCLPTTQIFLGDTIGELKVLYAAADVAFVAGSFATIGGHNVLEPISLNIPTITGPNVFNFAEINSLLLQQEALVKVQDEQQLAKSIIILLTDVAKREHLQRNGEKVLAQNRGALQKNLDLIAKLLPK
jgi:3-deoxy-D-manno-octulosonic-acid transferase